LCSVDPLVDEVVHLALVLEEQGADHPSVDHVRPVSGEWKETPEEEETLCQPIQGEPVEKNVGEELDHAEHGEDDPVHEPLGVIIPGRGLDRFH